MASLRVLLENVSDGEESDINRSPRRLVEQPRMSTLSTFVAIPNSDMPMSEGNEDILAIAITNSEHGDGERSIDNTTTRNSPEVDIINSLIPGTLPSTIPQSSKGGKLSRVKKVSYTRTQRQMHPASRRRLPDMDNSPERAMHIPASRSSIRPAFSPRKRAKKQHDVGMDVPIQGHNSVRGLPAPSEEARPVRSSDDLPETHSSLSQPASSSRTTPSAKTTDLLVMDTARPRRNRRNGPAKQSHAVPEESVPDTQPQNEEAVHSTPSPEVQVEDPSSSQFPNQSTGSENHPASPQAVVQEQDTILEPPSHSMLPPSEQRQVTPIHSLDREVSPIFQAVLQPVVAEETQRLQSADSGLFMTPESGPRGAQSMSERMDQERRVEELFNEYGSDDDEDCNNEVNISRDIHMPAQLDEALKLAHDLDEAANEEHFPKEFDDIIILKSYSRLKKTVGRWRSANNHSKSNDSIKLSNDTLREAKAILEKPDWNHERGLRHICKRVLPTLVRTLYVSLGYYLSEAGTIERLSYEPLKECRNITKAIINISEKIRDKRYRFTRPKGAITMVARIKSSHEILERHLRRLRQVKDAAEYAQRQQARQEQQQQQAAGLEQGAEHARRRQTQRERQQAADLEREAEHAQRQQTQRERKQAAELEEENELKIKTWREQWRVLHNQRFGAELEGQFCLPINKERHLRHIPLESTSVDYPYWDPELHVQPLFEGLQNLAGPDVYRKIFRKYCCRGGPLQAFNVSEIVDKAVGLRNQLMKITVLDGEDQKQWVIDIPDPRKPPVTLR